MDEKLLTKPARVHHTTFAAGLPERMVIECAQRHYEWAQKPANANRFPLSIEDLDAIRRGEPLPEVRLPLQGRTESRARVFKTFTFGVLVGLMLGVLCGGWAAGVVKAVAL